MGLRSPLEEAFSLFSMLLCDEDLIVTSSQSSQTPWIQGHRAWGCDDVTIVTIDPLPFSTGKKGNSDRTAPAAMAKILNMDAAPTKTWCNAFELMSEASR